MSRSNIESSMSSELEEEVKKAEKQELKEHLDFVENLFSGGDLESDGGLGVAYLDKLLEKAQEQAEQLKAAGEIVTDFALRQIQLKVCKEEASRILAMIGRSKDLKKIEREARQRRILPQDYTLKDLSNMIYEKLRSRDDYLAQSAHLKGSKKERG